MDTVRAHVYIKGRVQGVFYRDWTQGLARGLRLKGWVRNLEDGRVEAVFEGERKEVTKMTESCKKGPGASSVSHVDVVWEKATKEYRNFEVVR